MGDGRVERDVRKEKLFKVFCVSFINVLLFFEVLRIFRIVDIYLDIYIENIFES